MQQLNCPYCETPYKPVGVGGNESTISTCLGASVSYSVAGASSSTSIVTDPVVTARCDTHIVESDMKIPASMLVPLTDESSDRKHSTMKSLSPKKKSRGNFDKNQPSVPCRLKMKNVKCPAVEKQRRSRAASVVEFFGTQAMPEKLRVWYEEIKEEPEEIEIGPLTPAG